MRFHIRDLNIDPPEKKRIIERNTNSRGTSNQMKFFELPECITEDKCTHGYDGGNASIYDSVNYSMS